MNPVARVDVTFDGRVLIRQGKALVELLSTSETHALVMALAKAQYVQNDIRPDPAFTFVDPKSKVST